MQLLANTGKKKHSNDYYKFHRVCKLEECKIEIHTNRKDHYFCHTDHQQEWWKRQRSGDRLLTKEVSSQAKRIEELEETVKELKTK